MNDETKLPNFIAKEQMINRPGYVHTDTLDEKTATKSTNLLWVCSTWSIFVINLFFAGLSIRDIWINGYSPNVHWFSVAVLVATIGAISWIHNKVVK